MAQKLSWMLVIVISMALGGATIVGIDSLRSDSPANTTVVDQVTSPGSAAISDTGPSDVSGLFDKVSPSVVRITGQSTRTGTGGSGSGIVLDKDGYILTNNHVVASFDKLDVTFTDGTSVAATVAGRDPGNDLAVIKVDVAGDKLRPATLADSSRVRVGQFVVAIGYPFDIGETLTQGIVSAVGRTLSGNGGRPLRQLIQSDAAINPGNSGGGLFNASGELIGITAAIENPSGERVFVGVGYTIPINAAKRFLPDMKSGKTVQHPRIGVGLQDVTPAIAAQLGVNVERGVLITTVEPNSAGAKAGLRGGTGTRGAGVGDVVISIDGQIVNSFEDLANYIDSKQVGDKIEVKFVRDGREMTLSVTLEAWQGNNA